MSRFCLAFYALVAVTSSFGQSEGDSLRPYFLKEVIINDSKLKDSETGLNITKIDSLVLKQSGGSNLSELFQRSGHGEIRSYGPGGLSTPSLRGTGGSHTAILWNGINLQSPLSGQLDLSLVPVGFADDIEIQKGGSSSLYGSGAIGGSIQLNNRLPLDQGLNLNLGQRLGSFGNHYQEYKIEWGGRRFSTSTKIFRRKLRNDFIYTNQYVRPTVEEKRAHSGIKQQGVLQQNIWKLNPNQILGVKIWYQDNSIEIPNSILAGSDGTAVQEDEFVRGLLTWNLDKKKYGIGYKQAYIWHHLNYVDPQVGLTSSSTFRSWSNRIESDFDILSRAVFVSGLNYTFEKTDVNAFGSVSPDRHTTALYTSLRLKSYDEKLRLSASVREEFVGTETTPVSPSVGLDVAFSEKFSLKTNVSRNYRIPTFNDLYWNGDGGIGNSDLQPETSWSEELGFNFDFLGAEHKSFMLEMTVYSSMVDNWILWRPITSTIWSPENVKKVWSRGVELKLSGFIPSELVKFDWDINYNYTRTTNREVSAQGNLREIDKQLFYTPLHAGFFTLKALYKKYALMLIHGYTGKQYTDGENTEIFAIDPYQVLRAHLSRQFDFKQLSGSLRFEINNVLDEAYENRRGFPMYGRNYSIGLDIKFNKQNNDEIF